MIEIILIVAALGAMGETARRRGVSAWPFIVVGLVGYFVVNMIVTRATFQNVGEGAPVVGMIVGAVFLGFVYASIFILGGGGRRLKESWQCPECKFWNEPTTLVCPCGARAPEVE